MHAALPLGAERVPFAPDNLASFLEDTSCGAAACFSERGLPDSLETYTHAFVTCPVLQPVWAWVRARWHALADEQPPLDARALVVGDHTVWAPADASLWPLWTVFRLSVLFAIWTLRCARRKPGGAQVTADAAIAKASHSIGRCIRVDWQRVDMAERLYVHIGTSSAPDRPLFTIEDFTARWCVRSVFAHVREGSHRTLVIGVRHGTSGWESMFGTDGLIVMDVDP